MYPNNVQNVAHPDMVLYEFAEHSAVSRGNQKLITSCVPASMLVTSTYQSHTNQPPLQHLSGTASPPLLDKHHIMHPTPRVRMSQHVCYQHSTQYTARTLVYSTSTG